jgi:signal transduction histidine kinase
LIAGLGFILACFYIIRRRGFYRNAEWFLLGLNIIGILSSIFNAFLTFVHYSVNSLLVGLLLGLLLGFIPLCLFLAGYPRAKYTGIVGLGMLVFFVGSRLVFPADNGSGLAGILALVMLAVYFVLLYQQPLKIEGLFTGYTGLSLIGISAGSWIIALLLCNSHLPDFRYITKTKYISRFLQRIFGTSTYSPGRVMREFSLGISNITSPELLATVSIGLISEAVELEHGYLFSVDHETTPTSNIYRLQPEGGIGQLNEDHKSTVLLASNPVTRYFIRSHQPIRSEDFPGLPGFSETAKEELKWLAGPEIEVFAPVHTKEQWIGLICLGPKVSGAAYNENDLELIGTLADQLSLALQNARLIDSIMRVNNDFRRAYSAMEQSNRQLQQVISQLEKIDRTKSDFISVASHELRTPLTLIRGYTEMLLEEQSIRANDFQSKTVNGIYNGILRLQEILESMLDVASIDSRSFSLSKQPVSISQLINSHHKKLKPVLEERKLKLTVENLSFLPVIEADGTALNKVFSNLINNAIKYTPDGGTITISGVLVSPGQMNFPNGGVEIIIADMGIGIDPKNLELIFNKFFQAGQISLHSSGKTKYRGSGPGLGLAIAKGIIEAHGGIIWAESKGFNDQTFPGSQFYVVLPVSRPS